MILTGGQTVASRAVRAVLFVRNPFTHDARVLRAAHTLRGLGYDPLVVAVVSTTVRAAAEEQEGIAVRRLDPVSPFTVARRLLRRRRAPSGVGGTGEGAAPAEPPGPLLRLHRWLRTLDFYRRGIGVVLRERPALVQCNDYNTMWIGVAARALTGAAVVYDSHELWADRSGRPEPRWWLLLCEALFVRWAHCVVVASPGYADVLARRYRVARPAVVLNVPDAAPHAAPASEPAVAVYVGGLQRNRGLEEAIAALPEAGEVRLRLIGSGRPEYVAELRALARSTGVEDRLEVLPPVAPADVVATVEGAAFGLALFRPTCLSHRLVAPNKLFEYLVAGLPVLASDLPVMASYLRDGAGIAVAPDDLRAVAAALRALAEPERNRAARAAAVAAARGLTWERERGVLARCYERATSRSSSSQAPAAAPRV